MIKTQQGSCYHLSPINEEARKYDLEVIIKKGNHKSPHSDMNSAALYKVIIN